jgi:hypothetical protein
VDQLKTPSDSNRHRGVMDRLKGQAAGQLASQKDRASQGLGSIATAVRGASQPLRDQNHEGIAEYADKAATEIERFATRLRERDVQDIVHDAERFARERPAIFVGAAFAVGVLAARFLKSSAPGNYGGNRDRFGSRYGSDQVRAHRSSYSQSSRYAGGGM